MKYPYLPALLCMAVTGCTSTTEDASDQTSLTLVDESRQREIPVEFYFPPQASRCVAERRHLWPACWVVGKTSFPRPDLSRRVVLDGTDRSIQFHPMAHQDSRHPTSPALNLHHGIETGPGLLGIQ